MARLGAMLTTEDVFTVASESPTPGVTVTITASSTAQLKIARWTASQNTTVNLSGTPVQNALLIVQITNDAVLPRVITFGTGFASTGVITGAASKVSTIFFVSNGTMVYEIARAVGL